MQLSKFNFTVPILIFFAKFEFLENYPYIFDVSKYRKLVACCRALCLTQTTPMTHGRAVFNAIFDISREINICDYYSQAGSMCFNVILSKKYFFEQ